MSDPKLFLLEDSQDLRDGVIRLADRLRWQVISAKSIQEAETICSGDNLQIDVALIDLMLPRTDDDLTELNKRLQQREIQNGKLIVKGASQEDKLEALARLDAIDNVIMELIADEGGIEFLNTECWKKQFRDKQIPVAIFTARRADLESKMAQEKLKDRVSNALGQTLVTWFEKPVDPLDLEDWLKEQKKQILVKKTGETSAEVV